MRTSAPRSARADGMPEAAASRTASCRVRSEVMRVILSAPPTHLRGSPVAKTPAAPAPNDAPSEGTVAQRRPRQQGPRDAHSRRAGGRAQAPPRARHERGEGAREGRSRHAAREGPRRHGRRRPKYLPARDQGPQRKFVRDFVDGGWHLGEFVMPAMVLVILATFVPLPRVQYYSFVGLWIFILFVVGDMVITSITRQARGQDEVRRGQGREGPRLVRRDAHRADALPAPPEAAGQARSEARPDPLAVSADRGVTGPAAQPRASPRLICRAHSGPR